MRWDADYAHVVDAVVRPLAQDGPLRDTKFFLDTDWWRGPHVSVCFNASPQDKDALLARGLVPSTQKLLTALAPGRPVNPDHHQDLHERLGRYERRPAPLFPWLTDGTVGLRPLLPRVRALPLTGHRTVAGAHLCAGPAHCRRRHFHRLRPASHLPFFRFALRGVLGLRGARGHPHPLGSGLPTTPGERVRAGAHHRPRRTPRRRTCARRRASSPR